MVRVLALWLVGLAGLATSVGLSPQPADAQVPVPNFETVPSRPLAYVSGTGGDRLYVVNTPDHRLEVFEVTGSGLDHLGSVPVGMDPVAVAARTETELWVVNHLSDSVSIVDTSVLPPRVVRTLLVGDEPWNVVFAGTPALAGDPFPRAFVSAARRGQNHAENGNSTLKTPGSERADVWVFDAANPGNALGGTPIEIVEVFGDKPRALAASADGSTVYVGVFHSGNKTTAIVEPAVCDGGDARGQCDIENAGAADPPIAGTPGDIGPNGNPILPGGVPGPNVADSTAQQEVGLIVQFNTSAGQWQDHLGRNWNGAVPFSLPDQDVFSIDATATPPVQTGVFAGVGTILFDMAVHPSGRVYVANTEARNETRFEGPGIGTTTVRGHLHEAQITILDGSTVTPRHLNKHINYALSPVPAGMKENTLSMPERILFTSSGNTAYVAAFGSSKIGIFTTSELDNDTFTPDNDDHIVVSGGGPAGLALNSSETTLYVYTRFENQLSVVDVGSGSEIQVIPLHNPEPADVRDGRRFMYDAFFTSSNGESSCASCHVFGDKDDIGWDLGDPSGLVQAPIPNPFAFAIDSVLLGPGGNMYHPLKGPMTTQTFRGMEGHGPLHWRGDRTGANVPGVLDAFDENAGFREFNVAFDGLLGRDEGALDAADMQAFADFAMTILPPPNPIQPLTNIDTLAVANGRDVYFNDNNTDGRGSCNLCHVLDPGAGFYGTNGTITFEGESQFFKIAHLRNVYDKVGAFGITAVNNLGNAGFDLGDQIRGFGLLHDGGVGSVADFLGGTAFTFNPASDQQDVEDFMLAFPTLYAPVVGQQVTLRSASGTDVDDRVTLLADQADDAFTLPGPTVATECELVAKLRQAGESRGYLLLTSGPNAGSYRSDRDNIVTEAALLALAASAGQELTFTCAPPGAGERMAIDRDMDGTLDGEECGDINDDATVDAFDASGLRRNLAGFATPPISANKCDAGGTATCDIEDVVRIRRHVAGLGPTLTGSCPGSI